MKNSMKVVRLFVTGIIIFIFNFRPYDNKWSKTMIGYGPEDDYFVLELTYNYGVSEYKRGNDFCVRFIY